MKWRKFRGFVAGFVAAFAVVFFGVQLVTQTGIFRRVGTVYYDKSLTDGEVEKISGVLGDEAKITRDVWTSAYSTLGAAELAENEYIYNIYVPVADFYSTLDDIEVADVSELKFDCEEDCEYRMIPVDELTPEQKLISINGEYYLDSLKSGAVFRVVKFESDKFTEEIAPLVEGAFVAVFPEKSSLLTLAQTGVTALSRRMNTALNAVGDAEYFAAEIGDFLSGFDLTHTSNESSFSDSATGANICSDRRFIKTLQRIGLDIVELTGNHNQDCGDEDAAETIDIYTENGIKIVGGGKTAEMAAVPLELDSKGSRITMLAFNQSTGGATLDDTPGANQYVESRAAAQIGEAKNRGDTVIVDVQYYECNAYASEYEDATCDQADSAAGDQIGFFRHLIDLGADVVVGTSAHQPQTFELYGDGVIYYGLGNLFFDQSSWPGTTRSLVLVHYFYNNKLLQTRVVPTVYDGSYQTKLLDKETAKWFIGRLISARPGE